MGWRLLRLLLHNLSLWWQIHHFDFLLVNPVRLRFTFNPIPLRKKSQQKKRAAGGRATANTTATRCETTTYDFRKAHPLLLSRNRHTLHKELIPTLDMQRRLLLHRLQLHRHANAPPRFNSPRIRSHAVQLFLFSFVRCSFFVFFFVPFFKKNPHFSHLPKQTKKAPTRTCGGLRANPPLERSSSP